jgi:hypothetical protein
MTVNPIESGDDEISPPRPLGKHGTALWRKVQTGYYKITDDARRIELLAQACTALDRAEELAALVAKHGPLIRGRINPAVKQELATRAFVVSTLKQLSR